MESVERRLFVQAWATSIALHGVVVTVTGLLLVQMKPLPLQEPFQWNVSLVEPPQEHSIEPSVDVARPPAPQPQLQRMDHIRNASRPVIQEVQTRPLTPVVAAQQPIESPKAIERQASDMTTTPALGQHEPVITEHLGNGNEVRPPHEPQPVEGSSESGAPSVATETRLSSVNLGDNHERPDSHTVGALDAPISKTREETTAPQAEASVTAPSVTHRPVPEPSREAPVAQVPAVPKESISQASSLDQTQSISKTFQQAPATRSDYGWLIESLGARLAELKRYPTAARSSGLEGKVLLRAVIRADGFLADVSVQKSSGHEELDAAAMQTMRDASPLYLRHELGRAQIAITVPLVYKLTN
jgi:protein TonB